MLPSLIGALPGAQACSVEEAEALQRMLEGLVEAARAFDAKAPGAALELVRYLGERLPHGKPPLRALKELETRDIVFAWACSRRAPTALRELDALLDRTLRSLRGGLASPEARDDLRQQAWHLLMIGGPDGTPKLAQYDGSGSLTGWLRIVLSRMAFRAQRAAKKEVPVSPSVHDERALAPPDAELDFIRARYRAPFKVAFRAALAALATEERSILRLHFVEGLSHREIARLLGVHQSTATRRIALAQEELHEKLREQLRRELNVSSKELASLVRALRSGLETSMASLFPRSAAEGG